MFKSFTTKMLQSIAPVFDRPGRWVTSRFGPPSVITWEASPSKLPEAKPGNALVRIIATGIAGPDNIQRAGGYPNERCRLPGLTPGYDFVGEVVQLGSPRHSISVGDHVEAMRMILAHATDIELPVPGLLKIDRSDNIVKVRALPLNYMTAFRMLQRSGKSYDSLNCGHRLMFCRSGSPPALQHSDRLSGRRHWNRCGSIR